MPLQQGALRSTWILNSGSRELGNRWKIEFINPLQQHDRFDRWVERACFQYHAGGGNKPNPSTLDEAGLSIQRRGFSFAVLFQRLQRQLSDSSPDLVVRPAPRARPLLRPQVHLEHSSVGRLSRNPTGASNRVINSKGTFENCSRRRGDTLLDAGSTWLILVRLMVTSYIHGTSLQVVFYCCQVPKVYPLAAQSYSLGDSKIHG